MSEAISRANGKRYGRRQGGLQRARGVGKRDPEEIFKLMFASKASRLGTSEIDKCLRPFVSSRYQAPPLNAVNKLVSSFADWVDGMHTYRHAQGVEDPSPPPLDVALLIMGEGSSFLRWLIELDSTQAQV